MKVIYMFHVLNLTMTIGRRVNEIWISRWIRPLLHRHNFLPKWNSRRYLCKSLDFRQVWLRPMVNSNTRVSWDVRMSNPWFKHRRQSETPQLRHTGWDTHQTSTTPCKICTASNPHQSIQIRTKSAPVKTVPHQRDLVENAILCD